MSPRGRELVTADEPAVISEPFLDARVVEDGQGDGRLANTTGADESDRGEVFCETDDLLDQFVATETGPWRLGRELSGRNTV